MNKEEFINELNKLSITLTNVQIEQLDEYAKFLVEYNEHTNLTAIKNYNDILLKHFYDSMTIVKGYDFSNVKTLVDVGSGAGFPGMVIKILFPHIHVTLIDSNNKKTKFLEELAQRLNIKNYTIEHVRSEEFALNNLDKYDIVTARAVSALPVLTEICLPLVKEDGYLLALKGDVQEELTSAKDIITKLNGKLMDVIEFKLPYEDSNRSIVKIKKIGTTPNGYPRSYDRIKKALKKNTK